MAKKYALIPKLIRPLKKLSVTEARGASEPSRTKGGEAARHGETASHVGTAARRRSVEWAVVMRALKIIFGLFCFGIGVGFAVGAADDLLHPNPYSTSNAPWLGMFAAVLLLGSFLLLRRSHSPPVSLDPVSGGPRRRFNKAVVLSSVAVLAIVAGIGIYVDQVSVKAERTRLSQQQAEYERWATTAIRPDELSLTGVSLTNYDTGWLLKGNISNSSKYDLLRLDLLVTIKSCATAQGCKIIGQQTIRPEDIFHPEKALVPAGQMREFSVGGIRFENMPSVSNLIKEYKITQTRAALPPD
jgi:hypothetical protein